MMVDIKIGSYNGPQICTAFQITPEKSRNRISENSVSFWVTEKLLKIFCFKIYAGSKEHSDIKKLIDANKWEKLDVYVDKLTIKYLTPEILLETFQNTYDTGFREGGYKKVNEFRKLIGL